MEVIKLRDEYIKLGQALKAANLVESGVDAKFAVQDGLVKVNGPVSYTHLDVYKRQDNYVSEWLFPIASCHNVLIILKCCMDNLSFIWVHRFKGNRMLRSLYLVGNIFSQRFQCFLPSLTIILRIQLNTDILLSFLVYHKAYKILERIQSLTSLANQNSHVGAFQIYIPVSYTHLDVYKRQQ